MWSSSYTYKEATLRSMPTVSLSRALSSAPDTDTVLSGTGSRTEGNDSVLRGNVTSSIPDKNHGWETKGARLSQDNVLPLHVLVDKCTEQSD